MELTHIKRKVVVYAELPKLYEYKLGYFHAKYVFIKNGVKNHKNILENSGALLSCANKENQSRKIQNDIPTLF